MTDLGILEDTVPENKDQTGQAEFYLGTVTGWNTSTGVKVKLDGHDQAMQKGYKMMQVCRPLRIGSRVVLMKQSGTYIVLGEVSSPTAYYHPSNLSTSATLADVITRCNLILDILRNAGIIWNP